MKEKENLTAERSLEIIRESIECSQRTITKNSAYSLVWWGICVIAFALLISYLWNNHGGPVWNVMWAAMWVIGYLGERVIDKRKEPVPENFVSKTIGQVWATFGIFIGAIGMIFGVISCGLLTLHRFHYHGIYHQKPYRASLRVHSRPGRLFRCPEISVGRTALCNGCGGFNRTGRTRNCDICAE